MRDFHVKRNPHIVILSESDSGIRIYSPDTTSESVTEPMPPEAPRLASARYLPECRAGCNPESYAP